MTGIRDNITLFSAQLLCQRDMKLSHISPAHQVIRVDNVKSITDILNCLCIDMTKGQHCDVEATPDTLFFIVTGKAKATQARVGFQTELFEEYICDSESIKFAINLTILIDCLNLFGTSSDTTTAIMSYSSYDAMFKVSLEDAGVITTCDINSLYSEDFDELQQGLFVAFRDQPEECQIIIKSDALRDCIQELTEALWAGSIQVQVNNRPMFMKLSTGGTIGMSEINIPRASDAFVSFRCANPVLFNYPLRSLVLGMKALTVSKETYIRINKAGIMCVQHQIETAKGGETFLDFLMVAEEIFDDNNSDEEPQEA